MDWDWGRPYVLLLIAPGLAALFILHARSLHPMSLARRRALFALRSATVVLALLALAAPAWRRMTRDEAVVFILDHSRSQGQAGRHVAFERAHRLRAGLAAGTRVGFLSSGASSYVLRVPSDDGGMPAFDESLMEKDGAETDLAAAVDLARGLFPPGTARRIVLLGDGVQTRGDLERAARDAALAGIAIDAAPNAGEARPDVRVVRLATSRSRSHEGATVELSAEIESTMEGKGRLRLFENGVEVENRPLEVHPGTTQVETFRRTPQERNLYGFTARVEGFDGDRIPENDSAMALVDVQGRPVLLYVEGEESEAHFLMEAMAKEGVRLHQRPPDAIPETVQDLAGFDGVILSDVPARKLTEKSMTAIRDYVEQLGGGFLMIGGMSSFGVGGYFRTPIEEVLPVKIQNPDQEERHATALVLVIDRSGSMEGQKIEICKSAATATVELLGRKDFIGVVAFDSSATWVVPMTRVTSPATISGQIATIDAGGGTNIMPGMEAGHEAIARTAAKIKHMIVLTDGQSEGSGYPELAAKMKGEGITISTVGVGEGADVGLLQAIAAAGGGKYYFANDPATLPRIFTQDAMVHMGRMIREQAFTPRQVERHPMLRGWPAEQAPQLLGYVKTTRKATAQAPLVTDLGDPLLAHWRFGLGKVTAFTSDCKSRWAALWVGGWAGYGQFWGQVLRETAREPQGRALDLRIEEGGSDARLIADAMEDPTRFKNDAAVEADVYFVPAGAPGTALREIGHERLEQKGPGRYEGSFRPEQPGLYLVRARCGADLVSAGLVRNVSTESAGGRIDRALLEKVCARTGGKLLADGENALPPAREGHARYVELAPWLLLALLAVFAGDLAVRRWENVLGVAEWVGGRGRRG